MSDSLSFESPCVNLVPLLEDVLDALKVRGLAPRRIAVGRDGGLAVTLASVAFVEDAPEAASAPLSAADRAEQERIEALALDELENAHSRGF